LTSNLGEQGERRHLFYDGEDAYAQIFRFQGLEKVRNWKAAVDGGYNYNAS